MDESRFEHHIDVSSNQRAIDLLAATIPLSKQIIKQAMNKGCVWFSRGQRTQRLRRADKSLNEGDVLHIYYDEAVLSQTVDDAILIADETDYSVWMKPRGMLSQGSRWGDHCTINRWVEANSKPQRPVFLVHRLDQSATGVMLLAHSKSAAAKLAKLFESRNIEKHYRVIVEGELLAEDWLTITDDVDEKTAISHVRAIEYSAEKNRTLLAVKIETGRKHQIRKHLSNFGFPVVGDSLYSDIPNTGNLELAAYSLNFNCPITLNPKAYQLPSNYCPQL